MGDKSFYAQRDADGNSTLFSSIKMIDKWSSPVQQKGLDENLSQLNYPFMDSDGSTLYFSAQGENSMGGYDIFITRADSEENTFLKPDNIGFPFNSPANDYMYAIDDYNNLGWFASDRYQPADTVCVYVFVPNGEKVVYDYENTDSEQLLALASLKSIALTQTDEDALRAGRQSLAKVQYAKKDEKKKDDLNFVIDDYDIYHSLADFNSSTAKNKFQEMLQVKKDNDLLMNDLRKISFFCFLQRA